MVRKNKKVTGAILGTVVEYYDYSLYGFSAGILAEKFFPNVDKVAGLMYVFAIYAISYLAKPLGSIFFSRIGDKYGRRLSLKFTVIGIAVPTLIIGVLPDYSNIGVIATQILIICRFFQGFFVGGEYDGAAIYVIEHLGKDYHFTASAATRASGAFGLLLGIASTNFFNSSVFPEWGWRLPFLMSLPLTIITLHYRKYLEETPIFIEAKNQELQFYDFLYLTKKHWRTILLIILFSGGFGATYQISVIFMKQYLPIVMPDASKFIGTISVITATVFAFSMPIAGLIADKFGLRIITASALISTLITSTILIIAIYTKLLNLALISSIMLAISIAPFNGLAHGIMIGSFKPTERYRGISLGHTIGSLLMSGTANFICLYFMKNYEFQLFPLFYIMIFAVIAYYAINQIIKKNG